MKVYLLRHAETPSNKNKMADSQKETELTEEGQKDAKNLIKKLKKLKIDLFIVSPLKRTIQTLQLFLDTLENPKVIVSELTIERNLGEFTGTPMGTFQKYCKENNLDFVSTRPKDGESVVDVYERAKKFIIFLKKNYPDRFILICGHKVFLSCLELVIENKEAKNYNDLKYIELGEIREFEC